MANQECLSKGIPEYLHQEDKEEDQNFDHHESLYRRYLKHISNREEMIAALSTRNMSVNRDKFSQEPNDVLYNIRADNEHDHYFDCGILEFDVQSVENIEVDHPQLDNRSYSFKVLHEPSECMYPHSVVKVVETIDDEDNLVNDISSSLVKTDLKDRICDHIENIKDLDI